MKRLVQAFLNPLSALPGSRPPEAAGDVPPLAGMLRELVALDERVFGRYAFRREPLRGRFGPEETDALAAGAAACGRECARALAARHGTRDAFAIARGLGVEVDFPERPDGTDHVTFARFEPPRRVALFAHGLEKAAALLEDAATAAVLGPLEVERILLAHELFHFWEEANRESVFTMTRKAELWAPWPFRNRSPIRCLGEIAGMAFARELSALPYSPFVLDVFLLYGYSPAAAYALYGEIAAIGSDAHLEEKENANV